MKRTQSSLANELNIRAVASLVEARKMPPADGRTEMKAVRRYSLRMRAVEMVEDAGYTPVEALDADEAVAILESRSDIALMCTDIQMPGSMDGLGLAHAVHARWPSIKIIVVSGQLNPPSSDLPPCSRFFGKPLEAGQMIAQMRSMIGQA
jgi:CheY-like chemotaxis protein